MTRISKRNKSKNGSVLILALIMASILLSVGMGISSIAMKEIKLSSIGTESGEAFYMADTGAECALYWDLRPTTTIDMIDDGTGNDSARYVFPTSTTPGKYASQNIKCFDGIDITSIAASWNVNLNVNAATTTFTLSNPDIRKPCAVVEVVKKTVAGITTTAINSHGRSSCDPTNPRRVERGLKVSY